MRIPWNWQWLKDKREQKIQQPSDTPKFKCQKDEGELPNKTQKGQPLPKSPKGEEKILKNGHQVKW